MPVAGSTATNISTTTAAGSSTAYSRTDHVHALTAAVTTAALGYEPAATTSLSSYLPLSGGTMTGDITFSGSGNGVRFNYNNSNYTYTTELTINGYNGTSASYTPRLKFDKDTILLGVAVDAGSTGSVANVGYVNNKVAGMATTTYVNNKVPAAATSVTDVGTSATSAVGSSTAYARQDHVHALTKAITTAALGYVPL